MDLLRYNYIFVFLTILLSVLMSNYILNKTNKEMFKIKNKNN